MSRVGTKNTEAISQFVNNDVLENKSILLHYYHTKNCASRQSNLDAMPTLVWKRRSEIGTGIAEGDSIAEAAAGAAVPDLVVSTGAPAAEPSQYANWPLNNIHKPTPNDIIFGRGEGANKRYRKWVEDRKVEYVNSKRLDKPVVALDIVKKWRSQSPPGRFLKMDDKTGLWNDVGDKKAREKTSQALREKAPRSVGSSRRPVIKAR